MLNKSYNGLILIVVGSTPVILPVVSVDAFGRFMFGKVERTELGFVIKHVEIFIFSVIMNQVGKNFLLIMSEGAKISICTLFNRVRVVEAKIFFVF